MGDQKINDGKMTVKDDGSLEFGPYTRHHDISAAAAILGPTSPSIIKTDTAIGLGFNADAEEAGLAVEIPDEWEGTSDCYLDIVWHPEGGDVLADTEQVKWDLNYRAIAEGEAINNGTAVESSTTYTQSGAGTDKEEIITSILLDYDNGNQPLTAEDNIIGIINRDVSGESPSYSGEAIVIKWQLRYTANKQASH